jgi:hypothetical protein
MKLPPELSGGVELGLGRGARGTSTVVPARVVVCVVPARGRVFLAGHGHDS